MNINFKLVYFVGENKINMNHEKEEYLFLINKSISVKLTRAGEISCQKLVEISEALSKCLTEADLDTTQVSKEASEEISNIKKILLEAKNELIKTIAYMLDWYEFEEGCGGVRGYYFSFDEQTWFKIKGPLSIHMSVYPKYNLTPIMEEYIQKSLNGDYGKPFMAFTYLHKAKRDTDNKHKWINATIAAELAIKEFLMLNKPELTTFILEVPSPPLYKLYGRILESLFGKCSPKIKELSKGAEKRNKIIHSPQTIDISNNEVNKYIADVQYAIYHLLSISKENDSLINSYLE